MTLLRINGNQYINISLALAITVDAAGPDNGVMTIHVHMPKEIHVLGRTTYLGSRNCLNLALADAGFLPTRGRDGALVFLNTKNIVQIMFVRNEHGLARFTVTFVDNSATRNGTYDYPGYGFDDFHVYLENISLRREHTNVRNELAMLRNDVATLQTDFMFRPGGYEFQQAFESYHARARKDSTNVIP